MPELLDVSLAPPADLDPQSLDSGYMPVDEFGMPYLIHPYDALGASYESWTDDDHSFYQRNAPELQDLAGRALKMSRVQTVPRWLHNNKHKAFFDGTHLPVTEQDKFALTVLACAGYVSQTAVDMRNRNKPQFVTMSPAMHEHLQGRRQLHMERSKDGFLGYKTPSKSRKVIRKFFLNYIEKQELDVEDRLVDQFINTEHKKVKKEIGSQILQQAMMVAIEPIKPTYSNALKNNLVNPVFNDPAKVVVQLVPPSKWSKFHDGLEQRLAA